ncbi:helix-turn-helix domain-containing protein [Desulfospira joergensenii]|uniref:helix-turn-helix domain-containing protein n=1 Tax=Desulfospira joergensenii TaxID=53329 RepID=UPI0003FA6F28|nr:helix-turn-helix transcriptional regulator [Desulfospira joergensenii]
MQQTKLLLNSIKQVLKIRGITYRDLAERMQISEASVKRLFSKHTVSLARLEEICNIVDLDFYELATLAKRNSEKPSRALSFEQECILAQDHKLMVFLYFIIHGWPLPYIIEEYDISASEATRMLVQLDRLGIIELHPENKFRLLISKNVLWHKKGPIWNTYLEKVTEDFMEHDFRHANERLLFTTGQFTRKSLDIIEKKLDDFIKTFNRLAEEDAGLPLKDRRSTGLFIAFRPWVFSLISGLRRIKRRDP